MYKIYDIKGERGYNVTFDVTGKGAEPVAVVINRIRKEINPSDKKTILTILMSLPKPEKYMATDRREHHRKMVLFTK